jgi:hypothetical protein
MKEQQLFDWLKANKYPDLYKSTKFNSSWDCVSVENKLTIELKSRNTHYDDLLIEKKKYDRLLLLAAEDEHIPYYINSTPKGVWGFDLFTISIDWTERLMPVVTEFPSKGKIMKIVGLLSCAQGEQLLSFEV